MDGSRCFYWCSIKSNDLVFLVAGCPIAVLVLVLLHNANTYVNTIVLGKFRVAYPSKEGTRNSAKGKR